MVILKAAQVIWRTAKGKRVVIIDAHVSDRGSVRIDQVLEPVPGGVLKVIFLEEFMVAERLGLYEDVRRAAGLCPYCSGGREVLRCFREDGKMKKLKEKCPTCGGTGKAPVPCKTR